MATVCLFGVNIFHDISAYYTMQLNESSLNFSEVPAYVMYNTCTMLVNRINNLHPGLVFFL
jgi:hypothetical protein